MSAGSGSSRAAQQEVAEPDLPLTLAEGEVKAEQKRGKKPPFTIHEFQQAVQHLADVLLAVGQENRPKLSQLSQEYRRATLPDGDGYSHLKDEMLAVQWVENTPEQREEIRRAGATVIERWEEWMSESALTALQMWALEVVAELKEKEDKRQLIGVGCTKLQRRLIDALLPEHDGLEEWEVLQIVYPDESETESKLSRKKMRRLQQRLRSLQRELNQRLRKQNSPYAVIRPERGRMVLQNSWQIVDEEALFWYDDTPLGQAQKEQFLFMLRNAEPGEFTRDEKRSLRRIEVDESKRAILWLFSACDQVNSVDIWQQCKSRGYQDQSIRIALKELPLKAERRGFGIWIYSQISQK